MPARSLLTAIVATAALIAAVIAAPAGADEPEGARVKSFEAYPTSPQAGGHPDIWVKFEVGTRIDPLTSDPCHCNTIKDALFELPAGVIADPHNVAECTSAQFGLDECPVDAQVGLANPQVLLGDGGPINTGFAPLYNLVPQPGQAGLVGFKTFLFNFPIYTIFSPRTGGDFGLNAEVRGIGQVFALARYQQVMWGVPASPIHDADRFKSAKPPFPIPGPTPSNLPERPFLSMPTTCAGPLSSTFTSIAYDHGVDTANAPWPETTGCDQLNFNPSLSANPSTGEADAPSGLDTVLSVPQDESPETPSASELRTTTVTLPEGFSINPNAADGKTTCSDSEARFGTTEEAQCPEYAKVGTVSLLSSALPGVITGGIYLADPRPGDPYRLILTADGFATHIKLAGSAEADPQTGRLTVDFPNLPQSPFTEFDLHFFGSERALLATPVKCGSYAVDSVFAPWAAELPFQTSTQFFSIGSGPNGSPCPGASRPFSPRLRAVGGTNGAGAHSPFSVLVERDDGDQNLDSIRISTPPGFSATLRGIPYCPDSTLAAIADRTGVEEQADPACPRASRVGSGWAGAGAGPKPIYVKGGVYLAGPYKGAPLSLAVVTPAVSGPYDLGNVVVRVAVHVDPATAQVSASSDSLPQILEGIPLRVRSVMINLDRPEFTLNPTGCGPGAVQGALTGAEGGTAAPAMHYQVANCSNLEFAPKLRTKFSGPTSRRGHPALTAILTQRPGESNVSRAVVAMPGSEILDQAHIGSVCTRAQFAADACPADSVYGQARVVTPLLDSPLTGSVYLRSSSHGIPDLAAALRGPDSQPIEIDLVGRIDSVNGGIRTTFASIPDAPVSKFVLRLKGGKKGLLMNSTDLCRGRHFAATRFVGHNGAAVARGVRLAASCGGKSPHRHGKRRAR